MAMYLSCVCHLRRSDFGVSVLQGLAGFAPNTIDYDRSIHYGAGACCGCCCMACHMGMAPWSVFPLRIGERQRVMLKCVAIDTFDVAIS